MPTDVRSASHAYPHHRARSAATTAGAVCTVPATGKDAATALLPVACVIRLWFGRLSHSPTTFCVQKYFAGPFFKP